MRVDAHHHLWHYSAEEFAWIGDDAAALRRDFLLADLEAVMASATIDAAIAVQARRSVEETHWLLRCAAHSTTIARVVGWAPIASATLPALLDSLCGNVFLAGLREIVQDQPSGFLLTPAWNRGIHELTERNLTYDILIRAAQMEEAIAFVDLHPKQRFVLDHMGKADVARGVLEPWRTHLKQLARRANVFCKLSGLVTEADWQRWTEAQLEPYLEICLEAFGPDRCMAGSDWPVCLVAVPYDGWWSLLERWTGRLSLAEQAAILGSTATSFYGCGPVPRQQPKVSA